jgi:hypothetical protein
MPRHTTIVQVVDRASTLVGAILPLAAVITAAYLTWEHLTSWRDVAILVGMYSLTSLGISRLMLVADRYLCLCDRRIGAAGSSVERLSCAIHNTVARRAKPTPTV